MNIKKIKLFAFVCGCHSILFVVYLLSVADVCAYKIP